MCSVLIGITKACACSVHTCLGYSDSDCSLARDQLASTVEMETSIKLDDTLPRQNGTIHKFDSMKQNGSSYVPAKDGEGAGSSRDGAKRCCHFKVAYLLWLVVFIVWGLLLLPIIFYHLPTDEVD